MDESLITIVVDAKNDEGDGVELEIRCVDDDVLMFYLNHKKIFVGDWTGNFMKLFKRALKIWGSEEVDEVKP